MRLSALVSVTFVAGLCAAPVCAQFDGGYEVPFVPTPQVVVDQMLKLANIHKGDVLYDLGCGDGRIVVTAAKLYGIHAVGIDLNP
ncbi:MAG: class I SAM-dependent methyltransferase, partial [Acidobacteria bacterium]|nr:class I SAM-dependent methyltransferase [Acidobacteriota bacterium]